jgi:hypothetical protein
MNELLEFSFDRCNLATHTSIYPHIKTEKISELDTDAVVALHCLIYL